MASPPHQEGERSPSFAPSVLMPASETTVLSSEAFWKATSTKICHSLLAPRRHRFWMRRVRGAASLAEGACGASTLDLSQPEEKRKRANPLSPHPKKEPASASQSRGDSNPQLPRDHADVESGGGNGLSLKTPWRAVPRGNSHSLATAASPQQEAGLEGEDLKVEEACREEEDKSGEEKRECQSGEEDEVKQLVGEVRLGNAIFRGVVTSRDTGVNVIEDKGEARFLAPGPREGQEEETVLLKYEGEFHSSRMEGEGRFTWQDGAVYTGQFHIVGTWLNNLRHGWGRQRYSGGVYEGQWKAGVRHGTGHMEWTNLNTQYAGEWNEGLPHGWGVQAWTQGNSAESSAESDEDVAESQLRLNRYEGQFKNGVREGFGLFWYANGSRYEGCWRNNKKHGRAHYVNEAGCVHEALFENDRIVSVSQRFTAQEGSLKSLSLSSSSVSRKPFFPLPSSFGTSCLSPSFPSGTAQRNLFSTVATSSARMLVSLDDIFLLELCRTPERQPRPSSTKNARSIENSPRCPEATNESACDCSGTRERGAKRGTSWDAELKMVNSLSSQEEAERSLCGTYKWILRNLKTLRRAYALYRRIARFPGQDPLSMSFLQFWILAADARLLGADRPLSRVLRALEVATQFAPTPSDCLNFAKRNIPSLDFDPSPAAESSGDARTLTLSTDAANRSVSSEAASGLLACAGNGTETEGVDDSGAKQCRKDLGETIGDSSGGGAGNRCFALNKGSVGTRKSDGFLSGFGSDTAASLSQPDAGSLSLREQSTLTLAHALGTPEFEVVERRPLLLSSFLRSLVLLAQDQLLHEEAVNDNAAALTPSGCFPAPKKSLDLALSSFTVSLLQFYETCSSNVGGGSRKGSLCSPAMRRNSSVCSRSGRKRSSSLASRRSSLSRKMASPHTFKSPSLDAFKPFTDPDVLQAFAPLRPFLARNFALVPIDARPACTCEPERPGNSSEKLKGEEQPPHTTEQQGAQPTDLGPASGAPSPPSGRPVRGANAETLAAGCRTSEKSRRRLSAAPGPSDAKAKNQAARPAPAAPDPEPVAPPKETEGLTNHQTSGTPGTEPKETCEEERRNPISLRSLLGDAFKGTSLAVTPLEVLYFLFHFLPEFQDQEEALAAFHELREEKKKRRLQKATKSPSALDAVSNDATPASRPLVSPRPGGFYPRQGNHDFEEPQVAPLAESPPTHAPLGPKLKPVTSDPKRGGKDGKSASARPAGGRRPLGSEAFSPSSPQGSRREEKHEGKSRLENSGRRRTGPRVTITNVPSVILEENAHDSSPSSRRGCDKPESLGHSVGADPYSGCSKDFASGKSEPKNANAIRGTTLEGQSGAPLTGTEETRREVSDFRSNERPLKTQALGKQNWPRPFATAAIEKSYRKQLRKILGKRSSSWMDLAYREVTAIEVMVVLLKIVEFKTPACLAAHLPLSVRLSILVSAIAAHEMARNASADSGSQKCWPRPSLKNHPFAPLLSLLSSQESSDLPVHLASFISQTPEHVPPKSPERDGDARVEPAFQDFLSQKSVAMPLAPSAQQNNQLFAIVPPTGRALSPIARSPSATDKRSELASGAVNDAAISSESGERESSISFFWEGFDTTQCLPRICEGKECGKFAVLDAPLVYVESEDDQSKEGKEIGVGDDTSPSEQSGSDRDETSENT
ncbi:conserved hypothetical protein [Neospora caninum Liverpool]|uniref:MORN repeat-containing protein n=1 Tax=Neospora caninum (strain Liverpool) TaxID=572307 RepID=F0VKG3_NEOCL|nr:conserved hypothetical protein [Neospora caninum Liverpool]CBZ54564.1 conserved hypothetical protein [Neospora caninum Liverpool]|eukprot:XP_003884594.1 conserved hypothetical protein [Neospora caninum Liverpool]